MVGIVDVDDVSDADDVDDVVDTVIVLQLQDIVVTTWVQKKTQVVLPDKVRFSLGRAAWSWFLILARSFFLSSINLEMKSSSLIPDSSAALSPEHSC